MKMNLKTFKWPISPIRAHYKRVTQWIPGWRPSLCNVISMERRMPKFRTAAGVSILNDCIMMKLGLK